MVQTTQVRQTRVQYKRAIGMFVLAYIAVTVLAVALSYAIAAAMHVPDTAEPMKNAAYLLSERFLPFLNLLVWAVFAWAYFRKRKEGLDTLSLRKEALSLGAFWLVLAVLVDYVGFVLIKNPISLSPHDFYIGQFPWIYLIYVAVLVSPWCYVALAAARSRKAIN
jgi:hypothetical protein